MSTLETKRKQATVDRLLDDLRRLVEEGHAGDPTHEQTEELRSRIAKLVRSIASEDALG